MPDKPHERLFCCECGNEVKPGNAGRVVPALQPGTGGTGGSPRPHVWCQACLGEEQRAARALPKPCDPPYGTASYALHTYIFAVGEGRTDAELRHYAHFDRQFEHLKLSAVLRELTEAGKIEKRGDRRVALCAPWAEPPPPEDRCVCVEPHEGYLMTNDIREDLAAYAHEVWSRWVKHLLNSCGRIPHGDAVLIVIPEPSVESWKRQLATLYVDLSDEEKESARDEADKILVICKQHAPMKFTGWYLGKRGAIKDVLTIARMKLKSAGGPARELDVADILDALEEAGVLE